MEWLNYHHLRYFWTVAKEGSLAAAASKLRVSQPSISEQIRDLEESLGEKLFRREGRKNRLTDAGHIVFGYADEIFALGRELTNSVKQRPSARTLRFHVGIVDSFPKLVTNELLKPVFSKWPNIHVICREGKLQDLLVQLASHRLDIVFSEEMPSSGESFKGFTHHLARCGSTICAERKLAARLKRGFPKSLNGAPALVPADNTNFRRALEMWFRKIRVAPQVIAECEDLALMKVLAAEGRGFLAVPDIAIEEAITRYRFEPIGRAAGCSHQFYAITAERRIENPAAAFITSSSKPGFRAGGGV